MKEFVFTVTGMMCPHCEARVNGAVEKLGVGKVVSSHDKNETVVTAEELDVEAVKAAIRTAGYTVAEEVVTRPVQKKGIFSFLKK